MDSETEAVLGNLEARVRSWVSRCRDAEDRDEMLNSVEMIEDLVSRKRSAGL